MHDIDKQRQELVDSIIEHKGPWDSLRDRQKATHACQIVFNSLYEILARDVYEQYARDEKIIFKQGKLRREQ